MWFIFYEGLLFFYSIILEIVDYKRSFALNSIVYYSVLLCWGYLIAGSTCPETSGEACRLKGSLDN